MRQLSDLVGISCEQCSRSKSQNLMVRTSPEVASNPEEDCQSKIKPDPRVDGNKSVKARNDETNSVPRYVE